ncbi:HNH endonuclease [Capnocytophaga canimorsus]|uniref:HNH endonuclease n=1 Tax=Capnocytophaga canimorsus TaxID=28188 RepID=UPI0037D71188
MKDLRNGSPLLVKIEGKWKKITWHHHQNGKSMYPVKKEIHDKIIGKHTGGREIVRQYPELVEFFLQK